MKSILTIVILAIFQISQAQQKNQAENPEAVIRLVFEAFSEGSIEKMEQAVTADVKILEHGVVWNLDTIRQYFSKKRPEDFKRVNSFEFFQQEISGKMAFVSYHNRADIHANNRDRTVRWLESAVLVKHDNRWKVKMLHSTRLD
jgi:hypothetical protein